MWTPTDVSRRACAALALVALAGCATFPDQQQAFLLAEDGKVAARTLDCTGEAAAATGAAETARLPRTVRVVSWNLHKNEDPGWQADLARFTRHADLVLIQEAALTGELRRVLDDAGLDWMLASSFRFNGLEMGVLSAARVRAVAGCTQRTIEPLLRLPKSAVITRYRVDGVGATIAVANVHSVNFTLGLGAYREQLEAIAAELAAHRGPIVLAGDLNTWSDERWAVVQEVVASLGLSPVIPENDTRTRFGGRQFDYVFTRGVDVVEAQAPAVRSSDHNPVLATLRVKDAKP